MKASLGSRLGIKINLDHPTAPWRAKHAAAAGTKYMFRDCGKSLYRSVEGRQCIEQIAESGESVLFKPLTTVAEKAHK